MKVAIIGVGELGRYVVEELLVRNHEVVTISRSKKDFLTELEVQQHISDFSLANLEPLLADCDAVVSTITVSVPTFVEIHKAALEACQKSPTCKRFIPSFWGGDGENFPVDPTGSQTFSKLFQIFSDQDEVSWSAIGTAWFADYVYPSKQRYLRDIGEMWPQNYQRKVFNVYGNGSRLVDFVAVRDVARATVLLLEHDRQEWDNFTYVSGDQLTWKELGNFIQARDPEYKLQHKGMGQAIQQFIAKESQLSTAVAAFEIVNHSDWLTLPSEKVQRQKSKFFSGMKFRSVAEVFNEAAANPDKVL